MNKDVTLPFAKALVEKAMAELGSPVYIYDEAGIRKTSQHLNAAFGWAQSYKNYFAVKATPTPKLLQILLEEGMGLDCSSRSELLMAQRLGVAGTDIFYTSNNTPCEDYELAVSLDATVNIDDRSQVPVFLDALSGKRLTRLAARYNPGELKAGNAIIGHPIEAKYGMSLEQLVETFRDFKSADVGELGLHIMVASNELSSDYFAETAALLLDAVTIIEREAGVRIGFVNLGGGFGLNYKPDEAPFDVSLAAQQIHQVFKKRGARLQLCTENGRYVTGPHGYLASYVRYVMQKHKTYLGLDASMHNLMRPGMYGAYHHITILDADGRTEQTYDVVGSLCENNDKFAIDRQLPEAEAGDIVVVHDAGAHGHAMGFNYNGLLRSAEVLLHSDGSLELMRRAETTEDYFRNIIWP